MNLIIEHLNGFTIVRVKSNKINSENSPTLKAKLLIESQPGIKALIIDLTEVESVDSSGFSAFLLANRQLQPLNIPVAIVGVQNHIFRLFKLLRINELFHFFPTTADAVANLTKD